MLPVSRHTNGRNDEARAWVNMIPRDKPGLQNFTPAPPNKMIKNDSLRLNQGYIVKYYCFPLTENIKSDTRVRLVS